MNIEEIEAEMTRIRGDVMTLLAAADGWAARDAVATTLDQLRDAVYPYSEHDPDTLTAAAQVVLVDRSVPGAITETSQPAAEWALRGAPMMLGRVTARWGRHGGRVRLSGSPLSGRVEAVTGIGTADELYTGMAWYAARADGHPIEP